MGRPYLYHFVALLLSLFGTISTVAQTTVKYDPGSKTPVPFDQPFILQLDNFNGGKVKRISVFEIQYVQGRRDLLDRKATNPVRPSFFLYDFNIDQSANSLKIAFPALRPDRDFDALILSKFSTAHVLQAMKVIKGIHENQSSTDDDLESNKEIASDFHDLYKEVNNSPKGLFQRIVFDYDIPKFRRVIYALIKPTLDELVNYDTGLEIPANFTPDERNALYKLIQQEIALQYHYSALWNTSETAKFESVFRGELPAVFPLPVKLTSQYDFEGRLKNFDQSILFLDSLDQTTNLIKNDKPLIYNSLRCIIRAWVSALVKNREYVKKRAKIITALLQENCEEATWITQGTQSPDLATTGTRHATLDAGIMNIHVRDNTNTYQDIPKLFLGLNIYFRSFDKNSDFSKFIRPNDDDTKESHYLESRRTLFRRLSMTAGFTLGAYQNKDFDNVYGGLSFTVGPSVRLWKAVKISGGVAFLKRQPTNPVISKTELAVGNYFSISLDYDLLNAAGKITSKLFP